MLPTNPPESISDRPDPPTEDIDPKSDEGKRRIAERLVKKLREAGFGANVVLPPEEPKDSDK